MTTICIDQLTEEQLIELNHKIISRLRMLREMRSHAAMMQFSIGDKVSFHPSGHPVLTGIITRYNKKSVTIIADNGQRWNVHPGLLTKVAGVASRPPNQSKAAPERPVLLFPQPAAKPGS